MSILSRISPKNAKREIYRDFRSDFLVNPISNDLSIKTNEEAVKESLKNLILTNRGERLFQPNIGSDIKQMLFEHNTPPIIKIIKEKIKETISVHEPRAENVEIEISKDFDTSDVYVTIIYSMKNIEDPIKLIIFLERTR